MQNSKPWPVVGSHLNRLGVLGRASAHAWHVGPSPTPRPKPTEEPLPPSSELILSRWLPPYRHIHHSLRMGACKSSRLRQDVYFSVLVPLEFLSALDVQNNYCHPWE